MRIVVALLYSAAALAHFALAPGHVDHGLGTAVAFAASGIGLSAGLAGAVLSVARRRWMRAVGLSTAATTAVGYVVSRTVGLPGLEREPWDELGLAVTVAEATLVALALVPTLPRPRPVRLALSLTGVVAVSVVAVVLPAVTHHHGGAAQAAVAPVSPYAPQSADRPAGCVTPTAHRTLYVAELPPAPDGSVRLGYGASPATASIPGPTIEMTEGECLSVTVVNDVRAETLAALRTDPSLPLGVSLHVHGVKYTTASDGTVHNDSFVPPGESRTFVWYAAPRVTVGNRVVSLGTAGYWWYHDHVVGTDHGTGGVGAGLFGALVVRRPTDPRPDHIFVVPMGPGVSLGLRRHPDVAEFVARQGDRVEFIAIGLGDGFHTFHLHGHNWADNRTGMLTGPADETALIDNRTIGPADTFGFQVIAGEAVGTGAWMLHCHVQTHSDTGMMTFLRVVPADGAVAPETADGAVAPRPGTVEAPQHGHGAHQHGHGGGS